MFPEIDYTAWRFWYDVANSAATIIIALYVWWVTRKKGIEKRFSKIEESITSALARHRRDIDEVRDKRAEKIDLRCEQRTQRIVSLEKESGAMTLKLSHMPNHADIKELSGRIDKLHGSLSELNGRLSGINRAVDLINEFLINQAGK